MAMKKRYHTVNGMLIGETSNGVRRGYLPDALGSVVATVDNNGSIENTYRYKPYGSLLAKTGSAPDPGFLWTGNTGSKPTGKSRAEQYNRARHYGPTAGGWTSVDREWPNERALVYCLSNPTSFLDPEGMAACGGPGQRCCICLPKDYPPGELVKCTNCATVAGFKSIADFCKAYRDWKGKEPPAPISAGACCKLNANQCIAAARQACKKLEGKDGHDKCMHCMTSCCLAKDCGKESARYCGWCREMNQLLDCIIKEKFDPDDHIANEWGIDNSNKPCNVACKKYGAV